jgi:dipeptidyl-peptidase-4
MTKLLYLQSIFVLFVLSAFPAFSQKKVLTQEQLLKKMPSIVVPLPQVSWADDEHIVFDKRFLPDTALKTITIDLKNGKETITPKEFGKVDVSLKKVYLKNNDIYFSSAGIETRLTDNNQTEVNPVLSPDNNSVAFTRNNDLYVLTINTKKKPG